MSEKVNSLAKTNKKAVDFFRTKLQMRIDRKNQIMEITDIRAIKPGMVVSRGAQYTMTYSVYSDKLGNTRPANLRPVVLMLLAYVKLDLMNFCNLVEHYDAIKDLDFIWKSYHKDYKDE